MIDGETIELANGQRVRLVHIDTPEVYFGTECYGRQASATRSVIGALNRMRNHLAIDPRERATRELIESEHRRSVERLRPILDELAAAEAEADEQVYALYELPAHMRALVEAEYET